MWRLRSRSWLRSDGVRSSPIWCRTAFPLCVTTCKVSTPPSQRGNCRTYPVIIAARSSPQSEGLLSAQSCAEPREHAPRNAASTLPTPIAYPIDAATPGSSSVATSSFLPPVDSAEPFHIKANAFKELSKSAKEDLKKHIFLGPARPGEVWPYAVWKIARRVRLLPKMNTLAMVI